MYQQKTLPTDQSVENYLASIADVNQQADCRELVKIIGDVTGEPATMWGKAIVGFGKVHYKYPSGHEGDTVKIGLSARKAAITLYGVIFYDNNTGKLSKLGKHSTGKGCLYIKKLSDVDTAVLKEMIQTAYESKQTN